MDLQIRGVEGKGAVVPWGVLAKKEQVLSAYYVLSAWLSHLVSKMGQGEGGRAERNVSVLILYTRHKDTK